jgi:hypothetical protein
LAIGHNTNPSLAHFAAAAKKNPTTNPLPVVIFAVASQKDFTQTHPHIPGTNPQIEGGAICPPIVLLPVLALKLQEIPRGKKEEEEEEGFQRQMNFMMQHGKATSLLPSVSLSF